MSIIEKLENRLREYNGKIFSKKEVFQILRKELEKEGLDNRYTLFGYYALLCAKGNLKEVMQIKEIRDGKVKKVKFVRIYAES